MSYRNPAQLPEGGVLVVGASATGVQLASEIHQSGRPVTLSVGEHVRLPRMYRGRDVLWWMEASGVWNQRYDEIDDLTRARGLPSLNSLARKSGRRSTSMSSARSASDSSAACLRCATAARFFREDCGISLRLRISRWIGCSTRSTSGHARIPALRTSPLPNASSPRAFQPSSPLHLDLTSGEIRSIIWATGFHPDYSWLGVPVLDRKGHLRHEGGIVDAPGLYAIGLPILRRRKSTFIHGAEDDARDIVEHLANYLASR